MDEAKSNYAITGYCKGKTGNRQVVTVGVVSLSDISRWVDEWMDKQYEVSKRDIVRIVEVRVTRIEDSPY